MPAGISGSYKGSFHTVCCPADFIFLRSRPSENRFLFEKTFTHPQEQLVRTLRAPVKKKEKYACFLDISTGETVSVFGEALPVSREAASVSRQRNFAGSAHMLSVCMTKELLSREHALRRCPLAFCAAIIASQAAAIKNLLRRIRIHATFRF